METVKMTSQVQVRTKAGGRNMSADSTVEKDAFLKLLQEKRNWHSRGEDGKSRGRPEAGDHRGSKGFFQGAPGDGDCRG